MAEYVINNTDNSFIYAIKELLGTILIISVITAMSKVLLATGINELMISPFTKLIRNATLAYWIIGILMILFGAQNAGEMSDLNRILQKMLFISVCVILPSFALSIAGKYLNK